MRKVRLIYNPVAGDARFKNRLDTVIKNFQKSGYIVSPYRLMKANDMDNALCDLDDKYSAIAISGGDGTINNLINAMRRKAVDLPIGIFPFGTSNDFAAHIGIPKNISQCCDMITDGEIINVDAGTVNGTYFVNVCSAGLLADVPYKTDIGMKNSLGKMAYYLKGFEEIPKLKPIAMRMEYDDKVIDDNFYLFLVLNGRSAGGFLRLAPYASVCDGLLDVIAIKAANITNVINLVLKVLKGEHTSDPNIYHFQTDNLKISSNQIFESDIDGERGPVFPLSIGVKKGDIKVFIPSHG
ncbi:YegS/Rv2252/BmrU family lipid kinase [Lutispora saccharofermentans]|uniref:YegS/Rv2252/BmrU family lipid kinase n=1 Tax=Lutispora saccharofermentans TaxID=3024236 RepID=A0ABT1NJU5_9FIRM|nr:YegS/Rv2252/BmrU family lipid kinase [Lutispora saccharofermentans]MCQ1531354.1 YegS/Rv2252/BmrU family lipid kinase [Lutispora saccharofermentans]